MQLTSRQKEITRIVRENGPITGEMIAERLHVTRSALRGDLAVLLSGEVIAARRRLGYYYLGGGEDPAAAEIRSCTAESCMSRPVLVSAESNAYDAAVLLFTEDIGTLFVGKPDDVMGVVSRKDLLKTAMGRENLTKVPISMVMTSRSKMIFAEPDEDMVSVAQKLIDLDRLSACRHFSGCRGREEIQADGPHFQDQYHPPLPRSRNEEEIRGFMG